MGENRETREDDDGPFLPGRLFQARFGDDRRANQERARERQIAAQVGRRREHGGRPAARARRLGRSDIVDVAVTIADAEGTEAVSMRRIAKELQVGVMSLYWHVESKEELHRLMLETVQAEIEAADPTGDWRADLTAYARNTRAAMHRHPWAIDYIERRPAVRAERRAQRRPVDRGARRPWPRHPDHAMGPDDGQHVRNRRGAS